MRENTVKIIKEDGYRTGGLNSETDRVHVVLECSNWEWFKIKGFIVQREPPYIIKEVTTKIREYNPEYGDDRGCKCGHQYHRHFDSYDYMYDIGCKYCECSTFVEKHSSNKKDTCKTYILIKE